MLFRYALACVFLALFSALSAQATDQVASQPSFGLSVGSPPDATVPFIPPMRFLVSVDGQVIRLSGDIGNGSAKQLERLLRFHKSAKTVVFASGGGFVHEGVLLADIIRRSRLDTYVEGDCSSACTIAFLGGADRVIGPFGRLGFHSASAAGGPPASTSPQPNDVLASIYRRAGLSQSLIDQAIATNPTSVWYPSHEALFEAKAITRISTSGQFANMSTFVQSKLDLAARLERLPVFAALATRATEEYEVIVQVAWESMKAGISDENIMLLARDQLRSVFPRFIRMASDDVLARFNTLSIEQLTFLRTSKVEGCVEAVFPTRKRFSVASYLPARLLQNEAELMALALTTASGANYRSVTAEKLRAASVLATALMSEKQKHLMGNANARVHASLEDLCETGISFYRSLDALPVIDRVDVLRTLYSIQ